MISKDLTVTVTNEEEGITLVVKTVSALGKDSVSVVGDPGVYTLKDIKDALAEVEKFTG